MSGSTVSLSLPSFPGLHLFFFSHSKHYISPELSGHGLLRRERMELLCIFLETGYWVKQLLYEIYQKSTLVIKVFNLCFSDKMQFLQATNIGFCLVLSCKFVFIELKNRCQKMGFPVTISRRKSIEKKIFRQKTLLWD